MTDMNHVFLIGRLTKDLGADERSFGYVGNGMARANVSIAVNRSRKEGDLGAMDVTDVLEKLIDEISTKQY